MGIKFSIFIIIFPLMAFSQMSKDNGVLPENELQEINNKIDGYLQLSSDLVNKNLDSAMFYAEQANNLIRNLDSDLTKTEVLINLGDVYNAKGNLSISFGYYFNAKEILDNIVLNEHKSSDIDRTQINLLIKIGISFFYQKKYQQALQYYDEAMQALSKTSDISEEISREFKIRILNNIAAVYIHQFEYDKALEYYKPALAEIEKSQNEQLEAHLANNIGICYLEKKDFGLANYYFQRSLLLRKKLDDKRGIAQCYNNIGKNYVYNENFTEAKNYFLKALALGREIGNKESIKNSLQSLSSIYEKLGEYKKSLEAFKEFKTINDSLFNIESFNRISQLEMQYKFDKQEKLFDLELKRKETERKNSELLYLVVGGTLFFLLITSILLVFLQKTKTKNIRLFKDKLELEHKQVLNEKENLKRELDFKNRELTTNVMYLLKKNELITGISEKLIKSKLDFKVENQKIIQEIINELKSSQDKDIWSEFEAHFTQVHIEFYNRLNELFPNLSSNEKKLCAFLRLNMSTKDISAITYQSINSITVARSRLRKKLDIQGEDVNLINFLMQL
jgi:tetratricopeptide (TPR) repeat protein